MTVGTARHQDKIQITTAVVVRGQRQTAREATQILTALLARAGGSSGNNSGGGSGSDSDDTDSSSGGNTSSGATSEPEPSTVKFTGEDFGYPLINANYYPTEPRNPNTIDPREDYTVWATDYIKAQSLLEAMHAINAYRSENRQIKIVNGGAQNLDSMITDYCPTSSDRFAPARCAFYASLAYNKTAAQDGWQIEHRQNLLVPMMCGAISLKFFDCFYSLLGGTGRTTAYDGFDLIGARRSPIEGWQYEQNAPKIIAVNKSVTSYLKCSLSDEEYYRNFFHARPALSPWPMIELTWTNTKVTQYGTLIVWLLNDDTVEDAYRDVVAEHDGSNLCKVAFQLDLKDVQPSAKF